MTHEDRPYELHDDFLATLTRERCLKFRHMDTLSFSASSPSHHEPSKLKTSFSGESKHQTPSESQTALNNFKKGTKRDASVYYKVDQHEPDHRFPSQSNEKRGHWVGFDDNQGDHLTWKILTDDTNTIIIRSAVRSATKTSPSLRLDPPKGEDQPQDLTSDVFVYGRPKTDGSDNPPPKSIINFDDLLGRTILLPMDENGERKRATISEHVKDLCQQQVSRDDQLRFKLKIDGDQLDDLISYNQLMEYLEDKTDTGPLEDGLYRFKFIKDHKGPYTSSDPEYNGSSYNLLIELETGEQTWEPLSNIIASDPYTCAVYAKEHQKILESYEKTFGEKPKKTKTPLVGGDHPESDISDFCDQDQIKQYQTIVGQLILLSGLGRFDIAVHVMTMSRFRQQRRIGHLERLKKIVGYLANFPHGALRFRLHEPDYSNLPHKEYDWQRAVYGGAKEEIPHDIPEQKGKHVTTTTYVDANLHHDQVTGMAVTACLHIVNATPSHWYTKRQATVETATYGSEFVAARIATDQIIDLRYTLMYLGVPVRSKSYTFGDNISVVGSSSIPTSTLSKKSTLASYHRVREAIAAGYLQFNWKDGKSNHAEILSKHWEFANIWPLLKPLLFWKGDTDELNAKKKGSDRIPTKKSLV